MAVVPTVSSNNIDIEMEVISEEPSTSTQPSCLRRTIKIAYSYATRLVLPKTMRPKQEVDGLYEEQYSCKPPPITIFLITLLEIAVFIYYSVEDGPVTVTGPMPLTSVLIYNPHRRYEVWRFVTYMLIHSGWAHIFFNVLIQLLLGIPLEMIHKYWRVWMVYMTGVLAGSLGTSIADPTTYLAGASGGVYALVTGHLATIIMNYEDMEFPLLQLIGFSTFLFTDFGIAIYDRYLSEYPDKTIGFSAHVAGAIAGLLVGLVALQNIKIRKWERQVWVFALISTTIFLLSMIIWNVAYPNYFYPSQWD